jgi:steroid delta-isomerase-like uncharacterized protein
VSIEENRRVFEQWYDAFETGDVDNAVSFFSDDAVYEDHGVMAFSTGKAEVDAFWYEFFDAIEKESFACPLHRVKIDENGYAAEWTARVILAKPWRGLGKAGDSFEVAGCSIGEIRDGKITVNRDYYNAVVVLAQLGIKELPQMAAA